jgi:hypothetical protein
MIDFIKFDSGIRNFSQFWLNGYIINNFNNDLKICTIPILSSQLKQNVSVTTDIKNIFDKQKMQTLIKERWQQYEESKTEKEIKEQDPKQ